jgi:hypothetical protein
VKLFQRATLSGKSAASGHTDIGENSSIQKKYNAPTPCYAATASISPTPAPYDRFWRDEPLTNRFTVENMNPGQQNENSLSPKQKSSYQVVNQPSPVTVG